MRERTCDIRGGFLIIRADNTAAPSREQLTLYMLFYKFIPLFSLASRDIPLDCETKFLQLQSWARDYTRRVISFYGSILQR